MQKPEIAQIAVDAYAERVGGESGEPLETQVADLMADLMHLLADNGHDPESVVSTATMHFHGEVTKDAFAA
jgi:hypothetical protein